MKAIDVLNEIRETLTVRRIYGEPYVSGSLTVIPAATLGGGGGGGGGHDKDGQDGEGAGFGVGGRPAGAYVIKDGKVFWLPAINPNQIITMVGLVVIAYLISRARRTPAPAIAMRSRTGSPSRREARPSRRGVTRGSRGRRA